jgi:hypothetical protein
MSQGDDPSDWQELMRFAAGEPFVVERIRLERRNIMVEGRFAPPPLAAIAPEDQVFVAAFVRSHGSIKDMEQLFGVSYPTVKARLNRIAAALPFVDESPPPPPADDALARLERGEISVAEALAALKGRAAS